MVHELNGDQTRGREAATLMALVGAQSRPKVTEGHRQEEVIGSLPPMEDCG